MEIGVSIIFILILSLIFAVRMWVHSNNRSDNANLEAVLEQKSKEARKALEELSKAETWEKNTAKWRQEDYKDITTALGDVSDAVKYSRIKERLETKIAEKEAQIEKNKTTRIERQTEKTKNDATMRIEESEASS